MPKLINSHLDTPHDLVVASASLSELPDDSTRELALELLWDRTAPGGVLILVEAGDKVGGNIVKDARSMLVDGALLKDGDRIIAPCPHKVTCPFARKPRDKEPLHKTRYCHFQQTTERLVSKVSSRVSSSPSTMISDYSYLAVQKAKSTEDADNTDNAIAGNTTGNYGVILFPPLLRKKHVHVDLCCPDGSLKRLTLTKGKTHKALYRAAKATWGGHFPIPSSKKELGDRK